MIGRMDMYHSVARSSTGASGPATIRTAPACLCYRLYSSNRCFRRGQWHSRTL